MVLGAFIGALAGFFGGWVDAVLSRLTDIFLALPILLGAIVVLQMFKTSTSIWKLVLVITLFGWVSTARKPGVQHRIHGFGLNAVAQSHQAYHPQLVGSDHRHWYHVPRLVHRA